MPGDVLAESSEFPVAKSARFQASFSPHFLLSYIVATSSKNTPKLGRFPKRFEVQTISGSRLVHIYVRNLK
jgi:hypothetical protein